MPGRVRGLRGDGENRRRGGGRSRCRLERRRLWSALWEVSPKDEQGNVLSGDAWVHNSENCYINSDEKLVAAIGVENLVIVSTKDAVLVMNRERSRT